MENHSNDIQIKKIFSEDYAILDILGQGQYGIVYKVQKLSTGELSAIKEYKFLGENEGPVHPTVLREISLLKNIAHENIVKLKRANVLRDKIETELECCDSDLDKYIYTQNYTMKNIQKILRQILIGLFAIHSSKIIHRDLKPSNIFLNTNLQVKLGDFGFARYFYIPNKICTPRLGSLWYRAPELLLGSCYYSTPVDIWSIGCIFGELLCKETFFCSDSELGMLRILTDVFGNFMKKEQNILPYSDLFDDFPNFESFFENKKNCCGLFQFLMQKTKFKITPEIYDLLSKMLEVDPTKRISCIEALDHPFFKFSY